MNRARRGRATRARGFSLLEMVFAICLVAITATMAAEKMTEMRVAGEKTAFEAMAGTLRSGLGIRVADYLAKDRLADLPRLAGSNPMEFVAEMPQNYRGEFFGVDPALIPGGSWYFDKREGALVYRVRYEEYFDSRSPGPARVRLKIVPVYEDSNGNGRFDGGESLKGLRLAILDAYRWEEPSLMGYKF